MKVGVFLKSANHPHFAEALAYFAEGVRKNGDDAELFDGKIYQDCDVAIFWGSWKDRDRVHHNLKNEIIAEHKKKEKEFIVLETPILGRKITNEHNYLRIGINHFLCDEGEFNNHNCSENRWQKLQSDLNIDVKPWRETGEHIILVMQLPGDASLREVNITDWACQTLQELREYTNKKIIIRLHPVDIKANLQKYNMPLLRKFAEKYDAEIEQNISLDEHLENCWATITYTSGLAVDSILAGVPTIACNPGNFAWSFMDNNLSEIENPKMPDRTQWFSNLSYVQWNFDEIKRGLPWAHLRGKLINT